jgi:mono/diheme cytochrome c family protein
MGSSVWSLAALVLWLDGVGSPAPSSSSRSLTQLRDQARQVLEVSCGRCHDGTRPNAKPAALKIFDLHEQEWAAAMSNEQMHHMSSRFEGFGMPIPDRARVQAYIDAEIARRAESGAASAAVEPL